VEDWFDRLIVLDKRVLAIGDPQDVVESGVYAAIPEHTHTHGHLRTDHEVHEAHAAHPELRR
jgi:ABC-type Mn2+/Zn2+ transport system ATPase subunit